MNNLNDISSSYKHLYYKMLLNKLIEQSKLVIRIFR